MRTPYAPRATSRAWALASCVAAGYGVFLAVVAMRVPVGTALTGHGPLQPVFKAAMAVLLAVAASRHPMRREARWLVPALLLSAAGDALLAIPWWEPSFTAGLAAFLLAHLCFLAALVPLAVRTPGRLAGVVALCLVGVALLVWFRPGLAREGLTLPVTVYLGVLVAMAGAALLAGLPTRWTALGALCFAVSDAMIGIDRFVLGDERLAVAIWWTYAAAQLLITAGFFFGRAAGRPGAVPRDTGN